MPSSGFRRKALGCVAAVVGAGTLPGTADAASAVERAKEIAEDAWNGDHCPGEVDVDREALSSRVAGRAIEIRQDGRRVRCVLQVNTRVAWWWEKLCTVIVHEYGHFAGRGESSNPNSVMYPRYRRPYADCRA